VRRFLPRRQRLVRLRPPLWDYEVLARPETSDRASFEHIFGGAYELDLPREPRLIIDLGANVGYASVFFALRHPDAHVIAVEPVPANASLARHNVAAVGRVDVVEGGAWPRHARLALTDPGKGYWGMRVTEDDAGDVAAVTIPDLLERAGNDTIDLLKIDIEGAERQLFSGNTDWLANVGTLVLELHDRFVPGCRSALDEAVRRSGVGFDELRRGEDVVLTRKHAPARV
jgi:FkbM family methyltransferase